MTQPSPSAAKPGQVFPLGATVTDGGVNFSVFSKNATLVELLLFDDVNDAEPAAVIPLESDAHRTFYYWHAFVPGLAPGQIYAYRAHGPYAPRRGLRFDPDKVLLDPYGKAVATPRRYSRMAAVQPGDNAAMAMKSVIADLSDYDWEGDRPLQRPYTKTVIYEMHVGGFTKHPSSGVAAEKRGTFVGLMEKIPYLQDLGITAVELLPVFQFDAQDAPPGLTNYWGYTPVSFFAPHNGYASCDDPLCTINEFRDMVKALHQAGIEVILDVVYNHTAEHGRDGPTFCFRGLENSVYYLLDKQDRRRYLNYSGTGNTLNASNTIVRRLILDSLHYWVEEMHVDGFRFDLASILSRGEDGRPLFNPPTLWDIESDPRLAGTKLIAEAWDAAGLYQVGSFIGDRWTEWNGRFRDDLRAFMKGDRGTVSKVPARVLASPDLYSHEEREPEQSINFITAHDGFTLNDLVSYNEKHNLANREDNRDGTDYNLSWNCGVEGPTVDVAIERLRNRQVKNFLALTLLSFGTPMILMGDEARRTQLGNNNPYCQDNEISWFDWGLLDKHADIHRFVKRLIRFRLQMDVLRADPEMSLSEFLRRAKIQWHGTALFQPDWGPDSHALAMTIHCMRGLCMFHIMINAFWEPLEFELPPLPADATDEGWRRIIDTFLPAPQDVLDAEDAPEVTRPTYKVHPRSIVVLLCERRFRLSAFRDSVRQAGQADPPYSIPAA
ncbi:MAG: glycogen debranching protein GlgX [Candidatus Promineifilaceae bacterium]|nr:glycogen debranching protein GlgX [Candidatus Promineifilaceae bacterium]